MKPVASDGFAYALAGTTTGTGILRYDAATDRWDILALPLLGNIEALVAVNGLLVTLNFQPDHPGKDPAGAMLDGAGRWHYLPPLPSMTSGRSPSSWREAVWTGERLVISSDLEINKQIQLAALNVGEPGDEWTRLRSARSSYPRPNDLLPVAVHGRIVWPMVVSDLATGRSTPTPASVREALHDAPHNQSGTVPDMLILGDKVTLGDFAFAGHRHDDSDTGGARR